MPFPFFHTTELFPAKFDFYYESVQKGTCVAQIVGETLTSESKPGFAAGSTLTLDLGQPGPIRASLTPEHGAALEYVFGVQAAKSAEDKRIDKSALYSPFQPALVRYVFDEYDTKRKGFQTLPATDLLKGTPREISAELFRTEQRQVAGRKVMVREWRFETPPTAEAVVWTTESNDPLYWWVPSQNFEIVRRGFEDLRPAEKFAKSVSPPRFATKIDRDVWVPLRDGVRLMADVYRPDAPGKFPVILQRTCYDRSEFGNADGEFFAQRGYVYVTQHVRGRGGSEGEFRHCANEAADGYDTVAWCGTQPWSTGSVGMIGASYNGFCAWSAAKTRPRWLKTMISVVPMPGPPYGPPWDGGTVFVGTDLSWFGLMRDRKKVQPFEGDLTAAINSLPIDKADRVAFGHPVPDYDEMLAHDRYDAYVRRCSYNSELGNIDIPVLYFDGWLDTVGVATKLNFTAMRAHGAKNQKLVWGPWNHFTNQESQDGVTDFSPDGYVDMRTITLRWFDRWLKRDQNGIDREPSVDDFVLGENRWTHGNSWPPSNMRIQRWFLHANGSLAPSYSQRSRPSHYTYDPAKYVYSKAEPWGYFFMRGDDATDLCRKPGQLLFDSAPLKKPLRLDGPVRGRIYAATSAVDTDWVMALLDLQPDGRAVGITCGLVRARYRDSFAHPTLLRPGKLYAYDLDMWQTGIVIPKGHRLRIVVSSTLFPDKDRNLNTGAPPSTEVAMVAAYQSIYHDPAHRSRVELPVVTG
jgi:uncharacterized protein